MIDHIRAAIEACDTIGERVDYVATRYDAKRDSIRRLINREVAKQRKTVDTGADDDRDAFTFDDDEYRFMLAGEKTFSVPCRPGTGVGQVVRQRWSGCHATHHHAHELADTRAAADQRLRSADFQARSASTNQHHHSRRTCSQNTTPTN
jgi:hypothetical protein